MRRLTKSVPVVCLVILCLPGIFAKQGRFQSWYPSLRYGFQFIVDHNCSYEHDIYRAANETPVAVEPALRIWSPDALAYPLIQCILDNTPQIVSANMASAQVMLGLMPTILAMIGPSTQDLGSLLVLGKRPLLALCLFAASPSTALDRMNYHDQQIEFLRHRHGQRPFSNLSRRKDSLVAGVEYILVLAAIANMAHLCYEIPVKASFSIVQDATWLPALWTFIGPIIHLCSAIVLSTRVSVHHPHTGKACTGVDLSRVRCWLHHYTDPSNTDDKLRVDVHLVSLVTVLLGLMTVVLAAGQLLFGTLVFASILFVSTSDSLGIISRYAGSVLVCRIIAINEFATLQDHIVFEDAAGVVGRASSNTASVNKSRVDSFTISR